MTWETLGESGDGDFEIPSEVRRQHLYVLGRTGTGKSTMLARLAVSDIVRGEGLLVLDPHGDLVEEIVAQVPEEHLGRILYLDPSDRDFPVPLNMFECRSDQQKDTICAQVVGVFKQLYGDMWGPLLEDLLRSLSLAMLDHQLLDNASAPPGENFNATLKEAHDFLLSKSLRQRFYKVLTNDMVRRYWVDFYDHVGITKGHEEVNWRQIQYASSTMNKLRRFLLNPLIFDIFCNRDRRNPLDLRKIMDEKRVLLVNLAKGRLGEENSALIGSVLLSQLAVAALSRADMDRDARAQRIFHVIADEFQSFATASFNVLLSEARKYGVTVTIAHQHRSQLDPEARGATLNCGSIVCFRLTGKDADELALEFDLTPDQIGSKFERVMVPTTSARYFQEGRSRARDRSLFQEVPEHMSYGETARALANGMTQLPNYVSLVKLVDGLNTAAKMLPLPSVPPSTLNERLTVLRQERRSIAVPPDERRSLKEPSYFSEVRQQQAREVVYDAEVEDEGAGEDQSS